MNDKIIADLRMRAEIVSADTLVESLVRMKEGISQFEFIELFKAAFPSIPLRILNEASTSCHIVGPKGLGDKAVNELLEPWLSAIPKQHSK